MVEKIFTPFIRRMLFQTLIDSSAQSAEADPEIRIALSVVTFVVSVLVALLRSTGLRAKVWPETKPSSRCAQKMLRREDRYN